MIIMMMMKMVVVVINILALAPWVLKIGSGGGIL
jgi:hypothetical protein